MNLKQKKKIVIWSKKRKRKNKNFINKISYSIFFCLYPLMCYHINLFIYIPNAQLLHWNSSRGGHGRDLQFYLFLHLAHSIFCLPTLPTTHPLYWSILLVAFHWCPLPQSCPHTLFTKSSSFILIRCPHHLGLQFHPVKLFCYTHTKFS